MAWYDDAVFYHIYPLGLVGAPERNSYGEPERRFAALTPWIAHIRALGCTGLYIGPLFQSGSHGYDTTDYRTVDSRLGTNSDLKAFVRQCHEAGLRVILDGVFNHTGRDFFAFRDLLEHREQSRFRDWYCNVNFQGNNEYNDGFSYDNWGGYNLLARLNLQNPEVYGYLLDSVRFWVEEFDIDGLRLDAADVLDFSFMRRLREQTNTLKPDFWLMGEVIHGDYSRWANELTLHSVTNYHLHKALYSGHNDHNYFEIAHTVKRQLDLGLGSRLRLYNFVDNHDVERIASKLQNRAHLLPVHVLLYTLPGIPSVYYGSEFGIEGRKSRYSDAALRPCLNLEELTEGNSPCAQLVAALGALRSREPDLRDGAYRELQLTTTKYAFTRGEIIVTVNNDGGKASFDLPGEGSWRGALRGEEVQAENGRLHFEIDGNGGEIWIPASHDLSGGASGDRSAPLPPIVPRTEAPSGAENGDAPFPAGQKAPEETPSLELDDSAPVNKLYEDMTVPELQQAVLRKLAANGPLTDRMKREVAENVYRDSLLNWVRSFR